MSAGGLLVGLAVAILAGTVSRVTALKEDASLAGFYLISLALGVLIFCPRSHHERVVDRQAKNVVDTLGFELVVVLDVAWHVLRRARRREGAG